MFLKSQLYDQLWTSLRTNPSSSSLESAIDSLKPSLDCPVQNLHHQTIETLPQLNGKAVCLRMMIQDIFQPQFYTAALSKPGKIQSREQLESNVILNKYWFSVENMEEVDSQQNKHIILDRDVYRATVPKGQTSWLTKLNGGGDIEAVILKCYAREAFKLGQIVNVVGIVEYSNKAEQIESHSELKNYNDYYSAKEVPRIHVIAVLEDKQSEEYKLDYRSLLQKEEINFEKTRETLLELFQRFCSPQYAQFLLYSLINTQRMSLYLSGENVEPLLKHLLPFVVRVEVKIPFKQEIFPKKRDVMKDSLLQLSEENTYVIIDFTNIGEGKLQGEQVINLELLKKFAEDGEILYRWEIGQTLFSKNTSGIIAKAPTIIQPTFNLKNQSINIEKLPRYEDIEEIVDTLRAYIVQVRSRSEDVVLSSDVEKTLIEKDFVEERKQTEGKLSPETFSQRLLISRLEAASLGQTEISYKIYQRVKQITK